MKKQFFNFHKNTEENKDNMTNDQSQGYEGYQNYRNDYQQNYQQDSFYPYGQQTPEQDPHKKSPKKRKGVKTVAAVTGLAVLFGGIAGGACYGVNYLVGGSGSSSNQIAQADTASLTQVSSGTTDTDLTDLVKASMPFVVSIQNMSVEEVQNFFGGTSQQEATSVGSGIIIGENDTELLIVTNAHVVENANTLTVTFNDDTSLEANIKGSDSDKDLAVVAVPLDSISSDTKSAIKTAIVSAKDREISGYDGTLIQTNAAINPGNSGGALLNTKGEVIGINCAKISDSSVEGMGYAIPVSEVSDIIQNLMNQQTKTRVSEEEQGSLGVQVMDIDETTAERYGMPQGVYITGLTQDNTDSDLQRGYIITALNGTSITDTNDLQNELGYYRAGEDVTLTVQSAGSDGEYTSRDITVTLISSQSNQ